jgi:multiple sugar transport system ATP-binding protein
VSLTARVDPTTTRAKVGDSILMAMDAERIHIFDKETEKSLVL